jgi:hypothetical protein
VQIKKPIEVSAPKYVEYLMDWIESQLDDESIFPQRLGKYFTLSFIKIIGPSHHDHYFHSCCMTYGITQVLHSLPTLRML